MLHKKTAPNKSPQRLAVKLNVRGEQSVLSGHPWVFSNSIVKINEGAQTGDLAIIFGKNKNRVIGIGLYDANSPIRIKLIHDATTKIEIDSEFFNLKIREAFKKRESLLKTNTNSYRLLFGENDGFPGLIADVYADVLVVKLYSEIWIHFLESILESLRDIANVKTIVIRLSRKLEDRNCYGLKDGDIVYGILPSEEVQFLEHGVVFTANLIRGHKTGYFLDHRHNRKHVGEFSLGKTVLDVFSYAGGFSVHALTNGAIEVTSLDVSKQALELAEQNGQLNRFSGTHKTIVGDAFEEMKLLVRHGIVYDVVVIDPPSFAKKQSEVELAKKKYAQLAELGSKLTASNGLLVLASCSSRVTAESFYDLNSQVLRKTGRPFQTILKTQHDSDHPIGFIEGAYLKSVYYRFDKV